MSNSTGPIPNNLAGTTIFSGYTHAKNLYLNNNFRYIPKLGFMYFVHFTINDQVIATSDWDKKDAALLIKDVQLPKFKITTETLNQYNRKANIQTKINYEPVVFSFHDDVSNQSNWFWKNYYKYFYADSTLGENPLGISTAYSSQSKYGTTDNTYGYNPTGDSYFLNSIEIYMLHHGPSHNDYTKIQLINPMISSWEHDSVSQSEGTKVLQNKMGIVYEDVVYSSGNFNVTNGTSDDDTVLTFSDPAIYDRFTSPIEGSGFTNQPAESLSFAGRATGKEVDVEFSRYKSALTRVLPLLEPDPRALSKGNLSLGKIIDSVNLIKAFKKNPRQILNAYGINVKNYLINSAVGAANATSVNISGAAIPQTFQGNSSSNNPFQTFQDSTAGQVLYPANDNSAAVLGGTVIASNVTTQESTGGEIPGSA